MSAADAGASGGAAGASGASAGAAAEPRGDRLRVRTVEILPDEVVLIDQLALPQEERYARCRSWQEVAARIKDMTVRGAPAIGVAAAGALSLAARAALSRAADAGAVAAARDASAAARDASAAAPQTSAAAPRTSAASGRPAAFRAASAEMAAFVAALEEAAAGLLATRPTAVNLAWAVEQMRAVWRELGADPPACARALYERAVAIHDDDVWRCRAMGEHGAALFKAGDTILTHCNAGALATAGYGTALGVIRSAYARHGDIRVFVDETRPWLQGARLTAWELEVEGIPYCVIADNMAGYFLHRGEIQGVVTGADRIAANGDTANKIGTYTVAVLAAENGVPFYVAAPLSTVDLAIKSGDDIPIEERDEDEVLAFRGARVCPAGARARHPAFDVTPAAKISGIITEAGVLRPPYERSLAAAVAASPFGKRPTAAAGESARSCGDSREPAASSPESAPVSPEPASASSASSEPAASSSEPAAASSEPASGSDAASRPGERRS